MRSLILYGSPVRLTHQHKLVTSTNERINESNRAEYYVRAVVFNGPYEEAFDKAVKPMEGETFLNTVPLP